MSMLYSRIDRIVEKDYREKRYFSDKQPTTLLNKCFIGVAVLLFGLFAVNMVYAMSLQGVVL